MSNLNLYSRNLAMSAPIPLVRILESNRLTGLNYRDGLRNLKIVLISEKLGYGLDQDPPACWKICPKANRLFVNDYAICKLYMNYELIKIFDIFITNGASSLLNSYIMMKSLKLLSIDKGGFIM